MSNKINLSLFVAPNEDDNCTVQQAHEIIEYMGASGMGYDTISVLQGSNSAGPEDEITFAQLVAAKPSADHAYYIIGRYKADTDQKAYTLASDRAAMVIPQDDGSPAKKKDGLNSFIDVYSRRHPEHTRAEAEEAAFNIPAVEQAAKNELANIRNLVS